MTNIVNEEAGEQVVEEEFQDELGTPSDDGTTLYDILSGGNAAAEDVLSILLETDVGNLTGGSGDSLAERLDSNLNEAISSRSTPTEVQAESIEALEAAVTEANADSSSVAQIVADIQNNNDPTTTDYAATATDSDKNTQSELRDPVETDIASLTESASSVADILTRIEANNDPDTTDYGATATATDKNTDTEIRDGVWNDAQKASAADVGNTETDSDKNSDTEIRNGVWADDTKPNASDVGNTATATDSDKNTDTEIRDGVWDDAGKASSADVGNTDSDRMPVSDLVEGKSSGTLSADGTEQTVNTYNPGDNGIMMYMIDLSNMQSGDTVTVRDKSDVNGDGTFSVYESVDYSDSQQKPVISPEDSIFVSPNENGKVTLEQTAGTNRDYPWVAGVLH